MSKNNRAIIAVQPVLDKYIGIIHHRHYLV